MRRHGKQGLLVLACVAAVALGQVGRNAAGAESGGAAPGGAGHPHGKEPVAPEEHRNQPSAAAASTEPSITHGEVKTADGQEIHYTATAGYLPLKDEQGKLRANIFYTAYTRGEAAATEPKGTGAGTATGAGTQPSEPSSSRRPITFCFNGGPGAASVWLHLGALGPEKLQVPADGEAPAAPYRVVKNPYTWLGATDLVFVDPVNTGYSRAATPEEAKQFLGVREDISGMAEFIRLYLTENNRWGSPVILAGESYGTTRAAALSNYLQERVGVSVSGVILISTVLNFSVLSPGENNELPYALYLPSYAAVGWYHHKVDRQKYRDLNGLLKETQRFATGDYLRALAKGATLGEEEKKGVAEKVAALTGLPEPWVMEANLRIDPSRFEKELLRSPTGEGDLVIGRFDGRIVGQPTNPQNDSQEYDPSLSGFYDAYTSAFNVYVRNTLKFKSTLPYEVLSNRVYPWNWRSGTGDEGGYLYVGDDLRDAMTHNPHLKLLVCSGHFDLATPYFATDYQVDHLGLAPELRKNITQTYYPGGHMIYHVKEALAQLYKDGTTFIEKAAASQ